ALIDIPLERNPRRPQAFRAAISGKPAQTEYKVIKEFQKSDKAYSIMELKPTTGRTHQLRVHLAHIGHPIVGDSLYGQSGEHMYLHASSLELTLPGGERKVFKADTPYYFGDFQK